MLKAFADFDQLSWDTYTPNGLDSGGVNGSTSEVADYNILLNHVSLPKCFRRGGASTEWQTPNNSYNTARSAGRGLNGGNTINRLNAFQPMNVNTGANVYDSVYFGWEGMTYPGIDLVLSEIGSPTELWITFDWHPLGIYGATGVCARLTAASGSGIFGPLNNSHICRWRDVTFTLKSVSTSGARTYYTFALYLGLVEQDSFTFYQDSADWVFFQLHIKIDATTGAADVNCVGGSASFTGADTTTNALANGTTLVHFNTGAMHNPAQSSDGFVMGKMDNLYIDNAAFPAGRPRSISMTIGSVSDSSEASASGADTIHEALAGAGHVILGNTGAYATLPLTISGDQDPFELDEILGVMVHVHGAANNNAELACKLKSAIIAGADVSEGDTNRTLPQYPTLDWWEDGIYYKSDGTTRYSRDSDLPTLKLRLKVHAA